MYNRRTLYILCILGITLLGFVVWYKKYYLRAQFSIAILQTATHEALNNVRQGFVDTLQKKLGSTVAITIKNGEGSVATLNTLAQQLHNNDTYNLFLAIATPAAQALIVTEQIRPVLFSAVSDPSILCTTDQRNATGTSDMVNIEQELTTLISLLPTAKTIGIPYNTGEINSTKQLQLMSDFLEKHGITPVKIGITSHADIEPALSRALRSTDVLVIPTDNLLASSIDLIANVCSKFNKPFIVSYNSPELSSHGTLMWIGVDYYDLGVRTGLLALEILAGTKSVKDLPLSITAPQHVYVSKHAVDRFNIIIPPDIQNKITVVQ